MPATYVDRIVDRELDLLSPSLAAIALEGARGVGKTATAARRATTIHRLDDPGERSIAAAAPSRLLGGTPPILIDEWQRVPESWDLIRRAVDAGAAPGSFLLTGSASPASPPTHSGAGRIVSVRMRPMTLPERGLCSPTVSIQGLLTGDRRDVDGHTEATLEDYVDEIIASGFPGLRHLRGRPLRAQLEGYIQRVVDVDMGEVGRKVRNPVALRRWLAAYASASSTTASFETIRSAATGGHGEKPAKSTTIPYRDALERLWIVDPVPGWLPAGRHIGRLASPPKHQLVDPALAAILLGVDAAALLGAASTQPPVPRGSTLLGALFESLVTLGVRVAAQAAEARVGHLRTFGGEHEVDLIVERPDGAVLAIEIKLARTVDDGDVRHLHWLARTIGESLLDAVVVTTGEHAFRRRDGIAVVPAALLGP